MVNSHIACNTLNPEFTISSKQYRYKVANEIVSEFSSRIRGAPDHRVSHEMSEHANPGIMHLPMIVAERKRCKYCYDYLEKEFKSFIQCSGCLVTLCLNKDRNCFVAFHLF